MLKNCFFILFFFFTSSVYAFEQCDSTPLEEQTRNETTIKCKVGNIANRGLDLVVGKNGETTLRKDGQTFKIKLNLSSKDRINRMYLGQFKELYIFLYEKGDVEGIGSMASAYAAKDLSLKWHTKLYGFNLEAIQDGATTLVSTIDFVAKLDTSSGKILWKHENLYKKYRFNGGGSIRVEKDFIRFSDNSKNELVVNKQSGVLLHSYKHK